MSGDVARQPWAPSTSSGPRFAPGAPVVWNGLLAVIEAEPPVWSSWGWVHAIRLGNGLVQPTAESALSAAPENVAMPAAWRRRQPRSAASAQPPKGAA